MAAERSESSGTLESEVIVALREEPPRAGAFVFASSFLTALSEDLDSETPQSQGIVFS
jgi:hypothetical protein